MNFKQFGRTAQMFDASTAVIGKRVNASGTETNADMAYSDYIDVQGISKLTVSHKPAITNFYFYEEKTPAASSYVNGYTADVPVNAKYCRINLSVGDVSVTMLNAGDTALPYEPYGSTWHNVPHYIHKTSTDTITTPADIYANDTTAAVGLKGQMEQSGTPTPTTPIQPSECGERTGNLWNAEGFSARAIPSTHEHTNTNSYGTTISSTTGKEVSVTQTDYPTGNVGYQNGFFFLDVDFSKYSIGDVITLSFDYIVDDVHALSTQMLTTLYAGKNNNAITPTLSSGDWKISGRLIAVITIVADMNPYVEVRLCGNSITVKNVMLNTGSQSLPYEPYGIKIPILSNSATTNVYFGEVETTRKIKKLVLDGTEDWNSSYSGNNKFFTVAVSAAGRDSSNILSTHFIYANIASNTTAIGVRLADGTTLRIRPDNVSAMNVTDWKTYLQQQYANGTPVTVYYVLATPETAVVNEPIRKIGNYADEVSGITIPTIAGANTISVDTTLQPSEVTATYKGWHPVTDVHERENGAWT